MWRFGVSAFRDTAFRVRGFGKKVSRFGVLEVGVSGTGFRYSVFRVGAFEFWRFGVSGTGFAVRGFGLGFLFFGVVEVWGFMVRGFRGSGFRRVGISGIVFAVRGFGQGFSRFGVVELGVLGSRLRGS